LKITCSFNGFAATVRLFDGPPFLFKFLGMFRGFL
jgi:hypothetical protein